MLNGISRPPRVPLWAAYFAVGVVALLVHGLLEEGSTTQGWYYDVVGASAVLVALVGIVRHRPDRRLPWVLMVIGQASFVAGDVLWNGYELLGQEPFPSVADVLYLAGYPFITLGLLLIIRRRLGGGDRGGILDAAILTTACATLSWTFFIQPQVAGTEVDSLSLAITLAYPIADLILIGVALGFLATPGARSSAFGMLALSLVALLVADQIYAIQTLSGTYASGGHLDNIYLIAYILFGVAFAHPSMRRVSDPQPVAVTWLGPVRLVCLATAMVTGPILVAIGPEAGGGMEVIAAGTALLSLLVLARLYGLVQLLARDVATRRVLEDQLSYQAFHDPLTGLVNRRRFVEQSETALAARHRNGSIAALFLDLDDFKTVNDSLGHVAGDELLVIVAARIRAALREEDLAARLGGDEFGVLLLDIDGLPYATGVAERLLRAIQAPTIVGGTTVEVGASIGIAMDSPAMGRVDDLLGDADIAMYEAKALGKGRYHIFTGKPGEVPERPERPERPRSDLPRPLPRPAIGGVHLEAGAG